MHGQNMHRLDGVATADSDIDAHNPDGRLAMLFEGSFGGRSRGGVGSVLLDSGASANFVSYGSFQKMGISYLTQPANLRLADNSEAPTPGRLS